MVKVAGGGTWLRYHVGVAGLATCLNYLVGRPGCWLGDPVKGAG